MLLKHENYTNFVKMLLADRNKFKRIDKDPTNDLIQYCTKLCQ